MRPVDRTFILQSHHKSFPLGIMARTWSGQIGKLPTMPNATINICYDSNSTGPWRRCSRTDCRAQHENSVDLAGYQAAIVCIYPLHTNVQRWYLLESEFLPFARLSIPVNLFSSRCYMSQRRKSLISTGDRRSAHTKWGVGHLKT